MWYQLLRKEKPNMSWLEFLEEVFARYGVSDFDDFLEDFVKLKQVGTGTVAEYYKAFITLVTKAGYVSNEQQVTFFCGRAQGIVED